MTIPASTSVSELKTQLVSRCGLPEPQQLLSTMGGGLISGGFTIADICGTSSAVRMHLDCRSATARSDHANGRDATTPPVKPRQLDTLPSPHPSPSFAPRAPMVEMPFEPITFCRSQPKHDFAPADLWCAVQSQDVVNRRWPSVVLPAVLEQTSWGPASRSSGPGMPRGIAAWCPNTTPSPACTTSYTTFGSRCALPQAVQTVVSRSL